MAGKPTGIAAGGAEFHFQFFDNSNTMDAHVLTDCNRELLKILSEVSDLLGIDVEIEAVALQDGSLRQIWKFISDNGTTVLILIELFKLILMFRPQIDRELIDLQKENLRLENQRLERELENTEIRPEPLPEDLLSDIQHNDRIARNKSKYYEYLYHYEKLKKVQVRTIDSNLKPIATFSVQKNELKDYVSERSTLPD